MSWLPTSLLVDHKILGYLYKKYQLTTNFMIFFHMDFLHQQGEKTPGVEMLRPHLGSSQLRSGGREQVDLGLASSRIQSLTSKPGGGFKDFFKFSSRSLQK